jgi:hypothetical protein
LPSVDPPSEIRARVLKSIHQTPHHTRRWPGFRPALLTAPLAGALLLLVAALAYVNRPHSTTHTATGAGRRATAARLEAPPQPKHASSIDTAAPRRAAPLTTHVARKSRPPHHARPGPAINGPGNGSFSPATPQEPEQPVLSQQLPPTVSEVPARAPAATPPAVAALESQPAAQPTRQQRPAYGPDVPAAGGMPTRVSRQQPRATETPAPLPPGIAIPGTPPAFGAAPPRPTATPVAASPPTVPPNTPAIPPSTPVTTPIGVGVTGPITPAPAHAAPAVPPPASATPVPTPTP